jgi:hypothetical protein
VLERLLGRFSGELIEKVSEPEPEVKAACGQRFPERFFKRLLKTRDFPLAKAEVSR